MEKRKRLLAILLAVTMMVTYMPVLAYAEGNNIASGICGTCDWVIDANGNLIVSEGELDNYLAYSAPPWAAYKSDIVSFSTSGTVKVPFVESFFYGYGNLVRADLSHLDTSDVTDMSDMFWCCSKLREVDFGNIDTSKVIDMSYMFYGCSSLTNLIVGDIDTSKVTDMSHMFETYEDALTSLDLSSFDTSSVTNMESMFEGRKALITLKLSDNFSTSSVENMRNMFNGCESITQLDVSGFDTSKVTDMSRMFGYCPSLIALDTSGFNTESVTNMNGMFGCESLSNIDVSGFDTSKVTDMNGMFSGCSSLLSIDVSGFDTSKVTDMSNMFSGCESFKQLDISGFNTENVTNMSGMFYGLSLKNLDVSGLSTDNVTQMGHMFYACSSLNSLDLSGFKIDNALDMAGMLGNCFSLNSLKVGNWIYSETIWEEELWPSFPVEMKNTSTGTIYEKYTMIPDYISGTYVSTSGSGGGSDDPEDPDDPEPEYYALGKHNNDYMNNGEDFFNIDTIVFKENCESAQDYINKGNCKVIIDKKTYENYKHNEKKNNSIVKSKDMLVNQGIDAYIKVSDTNGFTNYTKYKKDLLAGASEYSREKILSLLTSKWKGACFGIAYTSILASEGRLPDIFGDRTYYSFGQPRRNTNGFRDAIIYYHLLQNRNDLVADCVTYSYDPLGISDNAKSCSEFLRLFVNEAKKSQTLRKPFIFNYRRYLGGGHSVVVCGYSYDEKKSKHLIKIWDCNKAEQDYLSFEVSNDYSEFSFVDANKHRLETEYKDMQFHGVDTIENYPTIASTMKSGKMVTLRASKEISESVTTVEIPADRKCIITNDKGRTLEYNGEIYTATMDVYDQKDIIDDNPKIEYKVEESKSFTITGMDDDIQYSISTDIGGEYYEARATGADKIVVSEDGVKLEGENYDYCLVQANMGNAIEFVKVEGTASGQVSSSMENEFELNMENCSDCTKVTVLSDDNMQIIPIDDSIDMIHIKKGDDGVDIKTNIVRPEAHTHEFGTWIVAKAATEIAAGQKSRRCRVCDTVETAPIPMLAPTLKSVKMLKPKAGKKSVVVKWKKLSKSKLKKIKKIEIQYGLDKSFKTGFKSTFASAKKTTKKISKLKKGKKYYVRIRAYTKSGGVVHVSKWTKAKSFKVK